MPPGQPLTAFAIAWVARAISASGGRGCAPATDAATTSPSTRPTRNKPLRTIPFRPLLPPPPAARLPIAHSRRLPILAIVALALLAAGAPAHADGCAEPPPPHVTLARTFAEPTVDTSLGLAALQALPRTGTAAAPGIGHLLGLTSARAAGSFDVEYDAPAGASGGTVCGAARQVKLQLGFDEVVIHIAREATGDRCLYAEIYAHESRHVQVDRDMLAQYGPWFEARLRAAVIAIGAVRGSSLDAVSDVIQQRIQVAFNDAFGLFQQEIDRRQRLIDSPEEYRRMSLVCDAAGGRLVTRQRPGG